ATVRSTRPPERGRADCIPSTNREMVGRTDPERVSAAGKGDLPDFPASITDSPCSPGRTQRTRFATANCDGTYSRSCRSCRAAENNPLGPLRFGLRGLTEIAVERRIRAAPREVGPHGVRYDVPVGILGKAPQQRRDQLISGRLIAGHEFARQRNRESNASAGGTIDILAGVGASEILLLLGEGRK